VQKITFVIKKFTKTSATRASLFDSNMHQIVCRLGLTGDVTALSWTPIAVFRGPTSKWREGERRGGDGEEKARGGQRGGRVWERRRGKGRGGERVCPLP